MADQNMRDADLISKLVERDGVPTIAVFKSGKETTIHNIVWGCDFGDEFAHITTNITPNINGAEIDFFFTHELKALLDGETRAPIFSLPI